MVVPDDQLSLAIGRRGQNVRLASQLSGWDIDILTEAEESDRRQEEVHSRTELFMAALDVDDVIAHLLVSEGFASVEEVAFVPTKELASVESFDEEIADELRSRALDYVEKINNEMAEKRVALGVQDDLAEIEGLSPVALVVLGEADIKTLDDLGDLAGDELVEILGSIAPSLDSANAIIMAARAHWFNDEPAEAEDGATEDGEAENGEAPAAPAGEDESTVIGEETGSP